MINRSSWASQTVANYYVDLRQIPLANVMYLDWKGGTDAISAEVFREKILGPILMNIERRRLTDQIDAIVYASDFPYLIDFTADMGKQQPPQQLSPRASITSATYLWQLTMTKNPNVVGLRNNRYVRSAGDHKAEPPSHGFRAWYGWGASGELIEGGGIHYMLSTMLAVNSGRGNSIGESIGDLRRSAKADGTRPKGTVYFSQTDDVRSKTRAGAFTDAIGKLKELGVAASVITTSLPSGRDDVAGLMAGVKEFSWPSSQSRILPGAICEHLTSFGGALGESNGQTPLTEFLRYGAAGASGSVVEPFAMQDKFPLPEIQVHYARGCSLVEAFYQSVLGPYQLLIVGDPLCQPWARIPKVEVQGITAGVKLSDKISIKAKATGDGVAVDRFELFVDGRRTAQRPAGMDIPLDTTTFSDGYHDVRVVAIDSGPVETQGRVILPITVDNHQQSAQLTSASKSAKWGEKLKLDVNIAGAKQGFVFFNGRELGKFEGAQGQVEVDPAELGVGPIKLFAVGVTDSRPPQLPTSSPLALTVAASAPLPPLSQPKSSKLARGLRLKLANGKSVPVQETQAGDWLQTAGVEPNSAYGLEGYFDVSPPDKTTVENAAQDVAAQGLYQFQVQYTGSLKLAVDQKLLHDGKDGDGQQFFLPVALSPGLHLLRISGRTGSKVELQVRYGGRGTRSIDGATFRQSQ